MRPVFNILKLSGRVSLSESFFYACLLIANLSGFGQALTFAQPTQNVTGKLERIENFQSKYVSPRHVDVWLPPNYQNNGAQRYVVLYMHDG